MENNKPRAVIYGAGNIGRGFIGQLLFEAGYSLTFIDVNPAVLEALNQRGGYPVRLLQPEGGYREIEVTGVNAVSGNDAAAVSDAIAGADIMATAVGVNVLKFIAKPLAAGFKYRREQNGRTLDIILCENLIGADKFLSGLVSGELGAESDAVLKNIGFVEASIGRMVPIQTPEMQQGDSLRIVTERYAEFPVDREAFKGPIPPIKTLVAFSPFDFYIQRKLYLHNMGHAIAAYLGMLAGYEFLWQCMEDEKIRAVVGSAMRESAAAMVSHYHSDKAQKAGLECFVADLLIRFSSRPLSDTVERVGKDARRKLSPGDRLCGAAALCKAEGLDTTNIRIGIAAALLHLQKEEGLTPAQGLSEVCKIEPDSEEGKQILKAVDEMIRL